MSADDHCTATRHGNLSAYQKARCRCPEAREAARLYYKRRREGRAEVRQVSVTGSRRRLQALSAVGHSMEDVAQVAGILASNLRRIRNSGDGLVAVDTHVAIIGIYQRWHAKPGRSERTKSYAQQVGWFPPAAWSDIDRDAQPIYHVGGDFDETAVTRWLAGASTTLTTQDRLELVRRLRDRDPLRRMA
jgi:hypothetical protein